MYFQLYVILTLEVRNMKQAVTADINVGTSSLP